jgi:hypothetical protein
MGISSNISARGNEYWCHAYSEFCNSFCKGERLCVSKYPVLHKVLCFIIFSVTLYLYRSVQNVALFAVLTGMASDTDHDWKGLGSGCLYWSCQAWHGTVFYGAQSRSLVQVKSQLLLDGLPFPHLQVTVCYIWFIKTYCFTWPCAWAQSPLPSFIWSRTIMPLD